MSLRCFVSCLLSVSLSVYNIGPPKHEQRKDIKKEKKKPISPFSHRNERHRNGFAAINHTLTDARTYSHSHTRKYFNPLHHHPTWPKLFSKKKKKKKKSEKEKNRLRCSSSLLAPPLSVKLYIFFFFEEEKMFKK
jgi:hypothetical protein